MSRKNRRQSKAAAFMQAPTTEFNSDHTHVKRTCGVSCFGDSFVLSSWPFSSFADALIAGAVPDRVPSAGSSPGVPIDPGAWMPSANW
jgi:hypothetical protein